MVMDMQRTRNAVYGLIAVVALILWGIMIWDRQWAAVVVWPLVVIGAFSAIYLVKGFATGLFRGLRG